MQNLPHGCQECLVKRIYTSKRRIAEANPSSATHLYSIRKAKAVSLPKSNKKIGYRIFGQNPEKGFCRHYIRVFTASQTNIRHIAVDREERRRMHFADRALQTELQDLHYLCRRQGFLRGPKTADRRCRQRRTAVSAGCRYGNRHKGKSLPQSEANQQQKQYALMFFHCSIE